jgi:hypothetical protein
MSKIHILESDNGWGYRVAIHFDTPAGNNAVGYTWKACGLKSGLIGSTILDVGTNPSNITQIEHDNILAGDIVEIVYTISPGVNPTNVTVVALCDILIATSNEHMARVLKYFGHKIEGT